MNHAEVRSKMPDYLEGDLDLTQRALLDAHLDACSDCSRDFAEVRGTIGLIRSLPDPEPPPFLVETVMRRIRDGEGHRTLGDRAREILRAVTALPVAVPATALALGLLMATGVVDPNTLTIPGLQAEKEPGASFVNTRAVPRDELASRRLPSRLVSASPPPAVAPAPQIQIVLQPPGLAERGFITQVASNDGFATSPVARRLPRSVRTNVASNPITFSVANPVQGNERGIFGAPERSASAFRTESAEVGMRDSGMPVRHSARLESRLEAMIQRPVFFSQDFAMRSIPEQEMWLRDLAEYAHEQGRDREALAALNAATDLRARQVATAFAAELRRIERANVASVDLDEEPATTSLDSDWEDGR